MMYIFIYFHNNFLIFIIGFSAYSTEILQTYSDQCNMEYNVTI